MNIDICGHLLINLYNSSLTQVIIILPISNNQVCVILVISLQTYCDSNTLLDSVFYITIVKLFLNLKIYYIICFLAAKYKKLYFF